MLKLERKILEWVETHIFPLTILAVTLAGILIRYMLKDILSPDANSFLLPWYHTIKERGGLNGLYWQVGCYSILYQALIAVMTYLPIEPLYGYKILSIIFDYGMAIAIAVITYSLSTGNRKQNALLAYALTLLCPIVFLNSAAWAQCDAMYVFFILVALLAFFQDRYHLSMILFGLALSFKLQAVFTIPVFLFAYFVKKKFSILYFAWIPVMMCVTSIPGLLCGRSIKEVFLIYLDQTDYSPAMHLNYPSFWAIMSSSEYVTDAVALKNMAMLMAVAVLGVMMVYLVVHKIKLTSKNILYLSFLFTYTSILFLPAMHERYGFCYEMLAIPILFLNRKTIALIVPLWFVTISTYGHYLFASTTNLSVLAVINVITFLLYWYVIWKDMKGQAL
ncbi:MAG: DUF2029 domain-containing protein [Lachnospiraceae bacterium]|nr:DUF2029 domain-containing protein [Lachnospiraceae bacterium]